MNNILKSWKFLSVHQFDELAKASNTLHHAAQFIALAGKYLLAEEADDSNTTAIWLNEKNWLAGNKLEYPGGYIRVILDYPNFKLLIANEKFEVLEHKQIAGSTKLELFCWLKNQLQKLGLDANPLMETMHYEMPEHKVDEGEPFIMLPADLIMELANYRSNGHLLLTQFTNDFKSAQSVLVWPHHFDEGSYIPLKYELNEVVGSISLGMAISDRYYQSPYFYVTSWEKEGVGYENPPQLEPPGVWHKFEWNGQVLTGEELVKLDAGDQAETAYRFLKQAIKNARGLIGWDYKS